MGLLGGRTGQAQRRAAGKATATAAMAAGVVQPSQPYFLHSMGPRGLTDLELAQEHFLQQPERGDAHRLERAVVDEVLEEHELRFFLSGSVDHEGREEAEGEKPGRRVGRESRDGAEQLRGLSGGQCSFEMEEAQRKNRAHFDQGKEHLLGDACRSGPADCALDAPPRPEERLLHARLRLATGVTRRAREHEDVHCTL